MPSELWAGIDVGGRGKGFHVAIIDKQLRVGLLKHCPDKSEVLETFRKNSPRIVAVDSPKSLAPNGQHSRKCERDLSHSICHIRFTPDKEEIKKQKRKGSAYYEWIENGLELYTMLEPHKELEKGNYKVIECFPTAAWTRWGGRRGQKSRAAWSSHILGRKIDPQDFLRVRNQDERDAIAAAMVAYLYENGDTDRFGEIVVPKD